MGNGNGVWGGGLPVQCAYVSVAFFPPSILKGWEHERQPQCLSKVKSWIISEVKLQTWCNSSQPVGHDHLGVGYQICVSHTYIAIHDSRKATVME